MAGNVVEIRVVASGAEQAAAVLKGVADSGAQIGKIVASGASDASRGIGRLGEAAKHTFEIFAGVSLGNIFVEGLAKLKDFAVETLKLGAQARVQGEAFRLVAESVGASSVALEAGLRRASAGLVNQSDTMLASARALQQGLQPDQLVKLMEIARSQAKLTGTTVTQAFNDITLAVTNQQIRQLKAFGIIIDVNRAYETHAQRLGTVVAALTEAGQSQAIFFAAEEALKGKLLEANTAILKQAEAWERLKVKMQEFREEAAKAVIEVAGDVARAAKSIEQSGFVGFLQKFFDWFGATKPFGVGASGRLAMITGEELERLRAMPNLLDDIADSARKPVPQVDLLKDALGKADQNLALLQARTATFSVAAQDFAAVVQADIARLQGLGTVTPEVTLKIETLRGVLFRLQQQMAAADLEAQKSALQAAVAEQLNAVQEGIASRQLSEEQGALARLAIEAGAADQLKAILADALAHFGLTESEKLAFQKQVADAGVAAERAAAALRAGIYTQDTAALKRELALQTAAWEQSATVGIAGLTQALDERTNLIALSGQDEITVAEQTGAAQIEAAQGTFAITQALLDRQIDRALQNRRDNVISEEELTQKIIEIAGKRSAVEIAMDGALLKARIANLKALTQGANEELAVLGGIYVQQGDLYDKMLDTLRSRQAAAIGTEIKQWQGLLIQEQGDSQRAAEIQTRIFELESKKRILLYQGEVSRRKESALAEQAAYLNIDQERNTLADRSLALQLARDAERKRSEGDVWAFFENQLATAFTVAGNFWGSLTKLAQDVASSMQRAFSDLFFNILEGKFKSLKDVVTNLFSALKRAVADFLASAVMRQLGEMLTSAFGLNVGGGGLGLSASAEIAASALSGPLTSAALEAAAALGQISGVSVANAAGPGQGGGGLFGNAGGLLTVIGILGVLAGSALGVHTQFGRLGATAGGTALVLSGLNDVIGATGLTFAGLSSVVGSGGFSSAVSTATSNLGAFSGTIAGLGAGLSVAGGLFSVAGGLLGNQTLANTGALLGAARLGVLAATPGETSLLGLVNIANSTLAGVTSVLAIALNIYSGIVALQAGNKGVAIGTFAGTAAGALAGAIVGSIVPGIGTILGALVGAAIGGTVGGAAGQGGAAVSGLVVPSMAIRGATGLNLGMLGNMVVGDLSAPLIGGLLSFLSDKFGWFEHHYADVRADAAKIATQTLGQLGGTYSSAALSGNPAQVLSALQVPGRVRTELVLPPEIAHQIGIVGQEIEGKIVAQWQQVTLEQFNALLKLYHEQPGLLQLIRGSGDVPYLSQKDAQAVANAIAEGGRSMIKMFEAVQVLRDDLNHAYAAIRTAAETALPPDLAATFKAALLDPLIAQIDAAFASGSFANVSAALERLKAEFAKLGEVLQVTAGLAKGLHNSLLVAQVVLPADLFESLQAGFIQPLENDIAAILRSGKPLEEIKAALEALAPRLETLKTFVALFVQLGDDIASLTGDLALKTREAQLAWQMTISTLDDAVTQATAVMEGLKGSGDIGAITSAAVALRAAIIERYQTEMKLIQQIEANIAHILSTSGQQFLQTALFATNFALSQGDTSKITALLDALNMVGQSSTAASVRLWAVIAALQALAASIPAAVKGGLFKTPGDITQGIITGAAPSIATLTSLYLQAKAAGDIQGALAILNQAAGLIQGLAQAAIAGVQQWAQQEIAAAQAAGQAQIAAIQATAQAQIDANTLQITALQAQQQTLQKQIDLSRQWAQAAESMKATILQLRTGTSAPPDAHAQFAAAQQAYQAALAAFQAGPTPGGLAQVQSTGQLLLQTALSTGLMTLPSPEYRTLFESIVAQLVQVQAVAESFVTPEEQAVAELKVIADQITALQAANQGIQAAATAQIAEIQASTQAQVDAINAAAQAEIDNINAGLAATMEAAATEQAGLLGQLIQAQIDLLNTITGGRPVTEFMAAKAAETARLLQDVRNRLDAFLVAGGQTPPANVTPAQHGEWRVPRDNMLYRLHEGERVLTPPDAERSRRGAEGGANIVINVDARGASDPDAMEVAVERGVKRALKEGVGRALVGEQIRTSRRRT